MTPIKDTNLINAGVEVGSNTRTVAEIHRIQNSIRYKISGAINLAYLLI